MESALQIKTRVARWERFFLEITNRCNFDCTFCPMGDSSRPKRDMSAQQARNIIDQLQALGFGGLIYFHVLGEPLLHPAALELVDYAADAGMRPVLFSNGGAFMDDMIARVFASKAHAVTISMQTINRQCYEAFRRTPFDWDTYLARIQRAVAMADNAEVNQGGCRLSVQMGIRKPDQENPGDEYFAEYNSIEQIKESISAIFSQAKRADLKGIFSELERAGPAGLPPTRISERLTLSVKPIGNWRRLWRETPIVFGRCPFIAREMAVLSNGMVTFCHIDYDGRTAVGDIGERSLADIFGASDLRRMLQDYEAGRSAPETCRYCRGLKEDTSS